MERPALELEVPRVSVRSRGGVDRVFCGARFCKLANRRAVFCLSDLDRLLAALSRRALYIGRGLRSRARNIGGDSRYPFLSSKNGGDKTRRRAARLACYLAAACSRAYWRLFRARSKSGLIRSACAQAFSASS